VPLAEIGGDAAAPLAATAPSNTTTATSSRRIVL